MTTNNKHLRRKVQCIATIAKKMKKKNLKSIGLLKVAIVLVSQAQKSNNTGIRMLASMMRVQDSPMTLIQQAKDP